MAAVSLVAPPPPATEPPLPPIVRTGPPPRHGGPLTLLRWSPDPDPGKGGTYMRHGRAWGPKALRRVRNLFQLPIACLIVTKNLPVEDWMKREATDARVPLLRTSHLSSTFIDNVERFLQEALTASTSVHGVLIDVVGDGPVHPGLVNLAAGGGLGWLDGFDELMARCGLENNGAPFEVRSVGADGAETRVAFGLPGRIANRSWETLTAWWCTVSSRRMEPQSQNRVPVKSAMTTGAPDAQAA